MADNVKVKRRYPNLAGRWEGPRLSRRLQLDLRHWRKAARSRTAKLKSQGQEEEPINPWEVAPVLQTWARRGNGAIGKSLVWERVALVDHRANATSTRALGEALFAHLKQHPRCWCTDVLVGSAGKGKLWVKLEPDGPEEIISTGGLKAFLHKRFPNGSQVMKRVLVVSDDGTAPWRGAFPVNIATYHRILAWSDDLPCSVPADDAERLEPGLLRNENWEIVCHEPGEPWFGAYTAVVEASIHRNVEAAPALANLWPAEAKRSPTDDFSNDRAHQVLEVWPAITRLVRDAFRPGLWVQDGLRIGVNALAWGLDRVRGGTPVQAGCAFQAEFGVHRVLRDHVRVRPGKPDIDRVARALRFERVGWAVGGGGAVSFRAVLPMEPLLAEGGIGMDLVAGISGGSVVAALVAGGGVSALRGGVADGAAFSKAAWTFAAGNRSLFDTWIKSHAGASHLGELGVPCYPLAVRLRAKREPGQEHGWVPDPQADTPTLAAFVHWDLGDAVLASGCAPPTLPPMLIDDEDGRNVFIDGGLDVMVPCRALPNLGADYVVGVSGFRAGYNPSAGAYLVQRAKGRGTHTLAAVLLGVESLLDGAARDADAYLTPPEEADVALLTEARRFGALDLLTKKDAWRGLESAVEWVIADHQKYLDWEPTDA